MKKTLLFGFMAVMLVAGTILTGCGGPEEAAPAPAAPAEKVYEWKALASSVRGSYEFLTLEETAADVERMSEGRLKITVFAEGEITGAEEYLEGLAAGAFQWGDTNLAKQAGKIPSGSVYWALPFGVGKAYEVAYLGFEKEMDDWMREKLAPLGIYYLCGRVEGGVVLWSKEPILRLADLEGMKIRAFGAAADMLTALGASVVYVPWPECYLAVSTGTVDAIGTMISGGYDTKLYEPCKGLLLTRVTPFVYGSFMLSLDAWNELPDDLKAIVTAAGELASYRYLRKISREGLIIAEIQKKYGVTATTWPDEDVAKARKLAVGVWEKMGEADTASTELLKMKLDYMKKIGYPVD